MDNLRLQAAQLWLAEVLEGSFEVRALAGDASFRRYFRVHCEQQTCVLMDAPPDKEDVTPFLRVRTWFENSALRVPALLAEDQQQGFLLLEDFADDTWAVCLEKGGDFDAMMADALRQLQALQQAEILPELPVFDVTRMQRECDLYLDWYLPKVLKKTPSEAEKTAFHAAFLPSLQTLAALPQAPVHLDYHSRNLMLPPDGLPLGVIDFQDAVLGPITYDLASLLYDCYQDYSEDVRKQWSAIFFASLTKEQQCYFGAVEDWHQAVRLTALQRHIKALGIFARLAYRDGKMQFLQEIPLTRKHVLEEIKCLDLPESIVSFLE